jgi:glutamate-1-semialdehyde 2,1-aminomutase
MIAGHTAMAMLTPEEFDRLSMLGQRVRTGLADVIEARGVSWQVSGQASLFKLHPHPRPLLDYRSTLPTPDEETLVERFYMTMLGHGVVLTPELAGCLSTPMTDAHVDQLIDAADNVFGAIQWL